MRIAFATICVCALTAVPSHADDACADPARKAEAVRLTQSAREADISGMTEALMSWPVIAAIADQPRQRIVLRAKEEFRLQWNEPDHVASIVTVFCKSLAPDTKSDPFEKFKELMAEHKSETDDLRRKWIVETLRKLQGEFPELNRPDTLLALGDIYGHGSKWEYAQENFRKVLKVQPDNAAATEWMGAIPFNDPGLLQPDAAKESLAYFRKLVQIEPAAPEAHYWIGVIDWATAFNALARMRFEYNKSAAVPLSDPDPLPPSIRETFSSQYGAVIDDGIQHLQQALKLSPDFAEAGFYLSYLYHLKGEEAASANERQRYIGMAGELTARAAKQPQPRQPRQLRPDIPPPPPPPPPDAASEQKPAPPRRLDTKEIEGHLVKRVEAKYPPLARQTKIEGTVVLEVVIDTEGDVESVTVVSGHPLLIQAAVDAVKQWRYKPWLIDGEPVKIDSKLSVIFSLH